MGKRESEMTTQELFLYRRQLFIDATKMEKKPDRVPHMGNIYMWKVTDAGHKISRAIRDWDLMAECVLTNQKRYGFDSLVCIGSNVPAALVDPWGGPYYHVDDAKGTISIADNERVKAGDYDMMIEDLGKYYWEVLLPRRFPDAFRPGMTLEDFKKPLEEYKKYVEYPGRIAKMLREECGVPAPQHCIPCKSAAMDDLLNWLRGIKGLSRDLRKIPDKLIQVVKAMDANNLDPWVESIKTSPKNEFAAYDVRVPLLAHNFLSEKQWEEFYWPSVKKIMDATVEADKLAYIYIQGSFARFYDYFRDYPKGHFALHTELDDVYEVRKALPNMCIAGGMPVSLLGNATPDECVAHAKCLIDDLGKDGGFILSEDKMVSFPGDAKAENMKAVCDFVRAYRP